MNEKILRFGYTPVKFSYSKLVVALCSCYIPFILFGDDLAESNVNITSSFTSQASFCIYIMHCFYLYFILSRPIKYTLQHYILKSSIERVSTCDS